MHWLMEQLRQLKSFLKVYQIHFQPNDCKFLEECKPGDFKTFRTAGRPNLLDEYLLKKVKNIAIGTRAAGGVINRRLFLNIAKGVVKANNPNTLKEYGGSLELTDRWARGVLKNWIGASEKEQPAKWNRHHNFLLKRSLPSKNQYQPSSWNTILLIRWS